jgi:hypothetical protein
MRPKRKKRRRKGGKGEVVEKMVGTCEAQLSWLQRQCPVGKERSGKAFGMTKCGSTSNKKVKAFRVGDCWGKEENTPEKGKSLELRHTRKGGSDKGVREYRERRKPSRETKARKKGGSVRQIPRGVSTKRGTYRACKWVRDGLIQGKKAQGEGSVKALIVERIEKKMQHKSKGAKGKDLKSFFIASPSKAKGKVTKP